MEALNSEIYNCRRCLLWQNAKNSVPGEGPITAKVMFIGQNPGAEEDQKGKPFIGRAGKFLTKTLSDYDIKREDIFITNIVKHVSPKNRKPTPEEVAACLPYLVEQIEIIKPKIIVLLGASAKQTPRINGIEYYEVIHPSAAMRFTKMREKFMLQLDIVAKKIASLK